MGKSYRQLDQFPTELFEELITPVGSLNHDRAYKVTLLTLSTFVLAAPYATGYFDTIDIFNSVISNSAQAATSTTSGALVTSSVTTDTINVGGKIIAGNILLTGDIISDNGAITGLELIVPSTSIFTCQNLTGDALLFTSSTTTSTVDGTFMMESASLADYPSRIGAGTFSSLTGVAAFTTDPTLNTINLVNMTSIEAHTDWEIYPYDPGGDYWLEIENIIITQDTHNEISSSYPLSFTPNDYGWHAISFSVRLKYGSLPWPNGATVQCRVLRGGPGSFGYVSPIGALMIPVEEVEVTSYELIARLGIVFLNIPGLYYRFQIAKNQLIESDSLMKVNYIKAYKIL